MFDRRYTADCRIYNMLAAAPRHLSFHTPGHKEGKWDITELSFSDKLSSPAGVLKEAQEDIARILGAARSFLLTDGSTCGVLSMLRAANVKKLLFSACSHKSVYNGCKLLGIQPVVLSPRFQGVIPLQPTAEEVEAALGKYGCDGVLLTSPDYYGNIAEYRAIQAVCRGHGVILLCDGAHGGHLKESPLYAGNYCDLWVDGVHKSLPAYTQGAVVSAKSGQLGTRLCEAVDIFRTTSPNYPIMASVEYAVKYPPNPRLMAAAEALKRKFSAYPNDDWTKIVLFYGTNAQRAAEVLEGQGVYPEFCDGENILFYLSPATSLRALQRLQSVLLPLEPLRERKNEKKEGGMPAYTVEKRGEKTRLVPLKDSAGLVSAVNAGLFPPCFPVVRQGQVIEKAHIARLTGAKNTFGLTENQIEVYDFERKTDQLRGV